MRLGLLSRSAGVLLVCGLVLGLLAGAGVASAAVSSSGSLESPAVRQAIASQIGQTPGPMVASQGGSGGTAEPSAPAGGELVPSLSTANSDTWRLGRQPMVSRIFAGPVNYKASGGAWHPISDQLVPAALGGYENEANSFSLHVPMSLSSGMSITTPEHSMSFLLEGGKEALPAVSGSVASYHEALSSTDFEYDSTSTGVQETATLENPSAPEQLRFALSASAGLTARREADGMVELLDGQGGVVFRIPAPLAFRPGADPGTGRVLASTLSQSGSGWVLSIDTSESWLRSELASGAVAVDPSVEVGSQNCWIESDTPTTSYCSQTSFDVGYQSEATAHNDHGLLDFNLSSLPSDVTVINAKLGLYLQSKSTSNTTAVGVYRLEKPWTTGATWNTYDGTHSWTTPGGDYANPPEKSDAYVNPSVGGSTGWVYWYPTKMVQEWVNTANAPEYEGEPQGYANDGLLVKDEKDSTVNNVLAFSSIRASSNQPYLEVQYQPRGLGEQSQFTILKTPLTNELSMGVNVASGDLMLNQQALHIPGRGPAFNSTLQFNDLNQNTEQYGHWTGSEADGVYEKKEGSVELEIGGAFFVFLKQASGTFITPPGIKATLCTAGHAPCPSTLPENVKWRLIYNQSQEHVDFYPWGVAEGSDRYGNGLKATYKEGVDFISSWTDTEGRKIEYAATHPETEFPAEMKDVAGSRHANFEYSANNENNSTQLLAVTDAEGHTTHYAYQYGDLTKITTPKGNVIMLVYSANHQIEYITRTTNTGHTEGPTTRFTYYKVGEAPSPCTSSQKATKVTDPDGYGGAEGHYVIYCANTLDEVEKTVNAEGKETKATFDPFGNQRSSAAAARETGGSGGVSSAVYGELGQNINCELEGTAEAETKCPSGALEKGYASAYKYEDTELKYQPSAVRSERQKSTSICYWGGSISCEVPAGEKGATGAIKKEADPLTKQNSATYSYNEHGQTVSSTDPDGNTTKYEYDEKGNLKTITPPAGSGLGKTTITVDADSRPHIVTQCLAESGGSCTSSETDTLTYSKLDQVTEAVYTGPGATKTFKYSYDADGNLEKRVDPTGTTNFTYDSLNRLTEEALPGSVSNAYTYDAASNLTSITEGGGTTSYLYNKLNEQEAMYEPGGNCGATPAKCTRFTYDNDGSVTRITYPSGATLNYTLDPTTGRPVKITAKSPAGATLLSNSYSYKESTTDTPLIYDDLFTGPAGKTASTTYEYDALDRLIKAETSSEPETYAPSCYLYGYDGDGNRTSEGYTTVPFSCATNGPYYDYNTGNELECRMKTEAACSKSSSSEISGYSYDGAGNETAITGYSDPSSTSFSYNNVNQLKAITPPSSSEQMVTYLGSGQTVLTGFGANALQSSSLGVTKQVNESGTSYYARTSAGLLVDERLPGGATYNPVFDAQGDVVGLLNNSGELVQTIRYGPYGENATSAGSLAYSATADPFTFQGGYHVPGGNAGTGNVSNGLYHFGERYYDPTTGRWTQGAESEGYVFGGDDPVNAGDPSGENYVYWWTVNQATSLKIALEGGAGLAQALGALGPVGEALGDLGTLYLETYLLPKLDNAVESATKYNHETAAERVYGGSTEALRRWGVTISVHTFLGGQHHDVPNGHFGVYTKQEGNAPDV